MDCGAVGRSSGNRGVLAVSCAVGSLCPVGKGNHKHSDTFVQILQMGCWVLSYLFVIVR